MIRRDLAALDRDENSPTTTAAGPSAGTFGNMADYNYNLPTEFDRDEQNGTHSVTVTKDGDQFTATRAIGDEPRFTFDDPDAVPEDVLHQVRQMRPFDADEQADDEGDNE